MKRILPFITIALFAFAIYAGLWPSPKARENIAKVVDLVRSQK